MSPSNMGHFKLLFVLCVALVAQASQVLPDHVPIASNNEAHVQRRFQNVSSTSSAVSSTHSTSLSPTGAPFSNQSMTISSSSQVRPSSSSSSFTSSTHQGSISHNSSSTVSTTSSHSASGSHVASGSQSASRSLSVSISHHASFASTSSTTSKAGQPTDQPTRSDTNSATRSETSSASESSKASSSFMTTSYSSTASTAVGQSTASSSTLAGQSPTSTTSTGRTTSSSSSSSQVAITTYAPPTTTVSGAAETSTIVAIAPVFAGVWKNKGDLEDAKKKDKYVEEVKKTKDQVVTLFKNLPDKPEPPSECSSTSGSSSGSLISGVLNILNTPAKLISCAEKVVGNLADAVVVNPPVIATVTALTETLKQIGEELEKDKKDDENTSRDTTATTTATTASSGCSTSTVKSCALTTTLSTLWVADGTTSSSKVKTVPTTSCATITGCSVTATTATTTVSTSTVSSSSGYICGAGCANGGCKAGVKRTAATPTAATSDGEPTATLEKRSLKPTGTIKDVDKYVIEQLKATIAKQLDWSKGEAVSQFHDFTNKVSNPFISGVTGCTAIVIASEKGAWVSHFMETALLPDEGRRPERDRMDDAVRDGNDNYIKPADLAGDGGALNKAAKPQVFVSAACEHTNGVCHTDGNGGPVFEHARVNELLDTLFGPGTPFEGIAIVKRGYIRPASMAEVDDLADKSARGKVLVQYDPNQRAADFSQPDPRRAVYRVWLESQLYEHQWEASQCQGGNAPGGHKRADSCPRDGTVSASATRTESSSTTTQSSSSRTESGSKTWSSATNATESSSHSKTASSSPMGTSSSPATTKVNSSSSTFKTSTTSSTRESTTPSPPTTKKPDPTTTKTKPAEPPATTTVTCSDEKRTFTQEQADEAIDDFCGQNRVYTLDPGRPSPYILGSTEMNLILKRSSSSSSGSSGCATPKTTTVSLDDCKKYFHAAVDACDKGQKDKHGAHSLTWRSPDGCIDFLIEAYAF